MLSKIIGALSLASIASAHYFLQSPPSIGFDDTTLTEAPCGGFSATDRSGGVTDWPINGYPFSVVTTHLDVVWTLKAALLSDVSNFVDIYPNVHQTGISEFCLPAIPGVAAWVGQEAVFQVVQKAPDGDLHQCAAIRFVAGGPAPQGDCSNSTSVSATTIPGTGPQPPSTTSRSSSSTTRRPTTAPISTTSPSDTEPTEEPSSTGTPPESPSATEESSKEPTEAPTDTESPTESTAETSAAAPTEEPTTASSPEEPTYAQTQPTYVSSPTVSSNSTTSVPIAPPTYTGAASTSKNISIIALLLAAVAWAL
ncbi:hypothetical protein ABW19_dt0200693 [Dactylella cylindrospora]|nr:hypothetical protein ABW19_dt0200693 [Dactylella cylindrospora]